MSGWEFVPGTLASGDAIVKSIDNVDAQGGWINTAPLSIKKLLEEKKVILIDFWTYTCINCIRATPYTQELWDRYKDYGLVVIGVHSPEFQVEKDPRHILEGVQKAHITYPIVTDANYEIWKAFDNHYWPAKYLIGPDGNILYTHFGEGGYAEEERAIVKALREAGWNPPDHGAPSQFLEPMRRQVTPELYAGPHFLRRPYGNTEQPELGKVITFTLPDAITRDTIYLEGKWKGEHDFVESLSEGKILLRYLANAPYIVLSPAEEPLEIEVLWNGNPVPKAFWGIDLFEREGRTKMRIDSPRLYYPLAHATPYGEATITFLAPQPLRFYSFTFGVYS